MPVVLNPRSEGARQAGRLIAKASAATVPGPRMGMAWGLLRARMEERVLPPGGVERTRLRWRRCDNALCGDDDCNQAGCCVLAGTNMISCARCWAADHTHGDVVIVGSLTASVGIECGTCGGRDLEVVGYSEPTEDPKIPGRIYYSPETKQLEVWQ